MKEDGIKEGVTGKYNQKTDKLIKIKKVIFQIRKLRLREEHDVLNHTVGTGIIFPGLRPWALPLCYEYYARNSLTHREKHTGSSLKKTASLSVLKGHWLKFKKIKS